MSSFQNAKIQQGVWHIEWFNVSTRKNRQSLTSFFFEPSRPEQMHSTERLLSVMELGYPLEPSGKGTRRVPAEVMNSFRLTLLIIVCYSIQ